MAETPLWIRNGRTWFRDADCTAVDGHVFLFHAATIEADRGLLRRSATICCRSYHNPGWEHAMTVIEPKAGGALANAITCADALAARVGDTVLLVGRLAMGIIFFQSGFTKLTGLSAFISSLGNRGVPFPDFWGPVGAISEFTGGTLIILGLGTRYAAALIVIFVIIATAISHRYWEFAEPARRLQ